MENAQFEIFSNGTNLIFYGCTLVGAKYDENPEKVEFGADWFIDESGNRIDIETIEDSRHPYDKGDSTLYVHIQIEGRTVKRLEIFEYANGTLYLEPDNDI